MTEEKSWLGEWTFDVDSVGEIKLFGSLKYSPSGEFILEASMKEDSFMGFDLQHIDKIRYIIGEDYKTNTNVTLIDSVLGKSSYGLNGGNYLTVTPGLVIENFFYEGEESLTFDSLSVKYSGMSKWTRGVNKSEINYDHGANTFSFKFKLAEGIECDVDELISIHIRFGYSTKSENDDETGFFFTEDPRVTFHTKGQKIDIRQLSRYKEHFRRLLQVLYYQPCFVLKSVVHKGQGVQENYTMYHRQVHKTFFNTYKLHNGYLTEFRNITDFPIILKKWFELRKSDDYTYVTWVASKHLFINTPFSEEVFLESVRVLEVYHKARYPKSSKQQETKTRLKERLMELLSILKGLVKVDDDSFIFKNENDIVRKLVINRNYLTHYGKYDENSEDILPLGQLYKYALVSRVILLTLLLNDVGIDAKRTFSNLSARHGL